MRTDKADELRSCPTCGSKENVTTLGLHNYRDWLNDVLPGRVSGTDIDAVVEQSKSGRCLFMEFKPLGVLLPTGQRLVLKAMVRRDIDVWVAWEDKDGTHVEVGAMDKDGTVPFVQRITKKQLGTRVLKWWQAGMEE